MMLYIEILLYHHLTWSGVQSRNYVSMNFSRHSKWGIYAKMSVKGSQLAKNEVIQKPISGKLNTCLPQKFTGKNDLGHLLTNIVEKIFIFKVCWF